LRRLASKHAVGIHAHAYAGMILQAARDYPEFLGPDLSLAHCTGIGPDEVRILADYGVSVVHGPYTHAYVAARCPVIELLEAGVTVAIGTDGSSPDRSFDLLAQVHPAMQLQRVHFADAAVLPAGKALAMVTIDAARALGLAGDIGSLEAGKKADLIVLDPRRAHLYPHADVLAPLRLAYAASGADVETVIVNGFVLMEQGRVLTVDEGRVLDLAQREAEALLERGAARDALALPPDFWTGTRYGV
jgi:5-methylthioadenosine/S-adenosylhomocysteine deaminase